MDEEAGFLAAIRTDLHDDVPRLVYADWLDERGDPRGEYLRVQVELARTWTYTDQRPDLSRREAELRAALDPAWFAAVRRCTTPAPPFDVEKLIPELRGRAKTTVRLHPRPGEAPIDASKIGGTFLWPAREEWPVCEVHDSPFVAALQLRKEDVPELGFRPWTDLFQLLWCPNDHEPGYCPLPRVFWRARSRIKRLADTQPRPHPDEADTYYLPSPCLLYFERVTEYPDPFEDVPYGISDPDMVWDFLGRLRPAPEPWSLPGAEDLYRTWLSTTQGTKVKGHPDWVQDPSYPLCDCGNPMEFLMQCSSREYDGMTWGRWLPVEDRPTLTASHGIHESVQEAPGWMFGDAGRMYLFICRKCDHRPISAHMQCS